MKMVLEKLRENGGCWGEYEVLRRKYILITRLGWCVNLRIRLRYEMRRSGKKYTEYIEMV